MFTLEQIKNAHSKVKSGADFPAYIGEMKQLGILSYEHFVSNGLVHYYGKDGFKVSSETKWEDRNIDENSEIEALKHALRIHQNGETTYPEFCIQAAESGVEKWITDLEKMTCTYYSKDGSEMLVEKIPDA